MNLTDCRAVLLTGTGVGPGWSTCGFNRLDWWEVTKRAGGVARARTSGALIPSGDHLKVSRAAARILNTHWPLGAAGLRRDTCSRRLIAAVGPTRGSPRRSGDSPKFYWRRIERTTNSRILLAAFFVVVEARIWYFRFSQKASPRNLFSWIGKSVILLILYTT